MEAAGIVFIAWAFVDRVRLHGRVAEIVIEPAGAGVGAMENRVDGGEAVVFFRERAEFRELIFEIDAVVKREIDGVQIRAAADRDRFVFIDA